MTDCGANATESRYSFKDGSRVRSGTERGLLGVSKSALPIPERTSITGSRWERARD
jgi:hypothetical protein